MTQLTTAPGKASFPRRGPHVGEPRRIPLPPVAETVYGLLRPDGTFEHRTLRGDLGTFLALLCAWRWMHGKEAA